VQSVVVNYLLEKPQKANYYYCLIDCRTLHYRGWSGPKHNSSRFAPAPLPKHTEPKTKKGSSTTKNESEKGEERRGETYDIKIFQVITYDATPLQIRPLWLNIAR